MISLKFNSNSWHYKIAKLGCLDAYYGSTDMCTYIRSFLFGTILAIIFGCLAFGVIYGLVHGIVATVVSLMYGINVFDDVAQLGMYLFSIIAIFGIVLVVAYKHTIYIEKKYPDGQPYKPDGFIKNAYSGWKEKYCARITFIDSAETESGNSSKSDGYDGY